MKDVDCTKLQDEDVEVIIIYKSYDISSADAMRKAITLINENL